MTTKTTRQSIPFTFFLNRDVDPITILSRPENISFQYRKRIQRYRTRGAWIEEDWGDELDRISGSGRTDTFIHPEIGLTSADPIDKKGATRQFAFETQAYREFKELVELYRQNGITYNDLGNPIDGPYDSSVTQANAVTMEYRESVYRGFFEDFTWTEDADTPFNFSWSFSFVVLKTVFGY